MSEVLYDLKDHVAVITLNRPEFMNTFNMEMYTAFNEATAKFRDDDDAWVAVITAAGDKAFSAGVDIHNAQAMFIQNAAESAKKFTVDLQCEYYCDKPVIAAIQGHCVGEGLSLALGCDMRIAGKGASFSLPEAKVGIPAINAAIHGANIMGVSNALELLLLGEARDADWAYRTGLVNIVVPDDEILSTAMDWANKIASLSPLANYITKEAAKRSQYRSFEEVETVGAKRRMAHLLTEDAMEGPRAFLEKRRPVFKGK